MKITNNLFILISFKSHEKKDKSQLFYLPLKQKNQINNYENTINVNVRRIFFHNIFHNFEQKKALSLEYNSHVIPTQHCFFYIMLSLFHLTVTFVFFHVHTRFGVSQMSALVTFLFIFRFGYFN